MIDFNDIASFFDDVQVIDPQTGDLLFYGQLEPYDDSRRDGVGGERRILSYDPRSGAPLPPTRTVKFSDRLWIVGKSQPDEFLGSTVRAKFVVQRADATMESGTAAAWLRHDARLVLACGHVWTKDVKQLEVTSDARSFYTLYIGSAQPALDGQLIRFENRMHRVVNCNQGSSGLQAVEITELPVDCFQTVVHKSKSRFDPVAGRNIVASDREQLALVMPFFDQYRLVSQAQARPSKGDLQIRTLISDGLVSAGDTIQVGEFDMVTQTVLTETDGTYLVHLSR